MLHLGGDAVIAAHHRLCYARPNITLTVALRESIHNISYLRTLLVPTLALVVFIARPDQTWALLAALAAPHVLDLLMSRGGDETRPPDRRHLTWLMDLILNTQLALHFANLTLALFWVRDAGLFSLEGALALSYLIQSGGLTAAVGGHEQLHSPSKWRRLAGRLLYASMLYGHWCSEHLWGHHRHYGTLRDPTTARFDESLAGFLRRAIPAQWAAAWRVEIDRHQGRGPLMRWVRNWVLQGLIAQAMMLAAALLIFGPGGLGLFVLQAIGVTLGLLIINYLEHWGLDRDKVPSVGSWDTAHAGTLFAMIGLARHADHHLNAGRRFFELRLDAKAPRLPAGYTALSVLALFANRRFRALMRQALERQGLACLGS